MSEKPLANVVICCTSVTQDERSVIIRQAIDMGAVSQADLTSDVTHLIAARLQTEKYRFAARHRTDLKLMSVEWISAIHNIWMSGKDVDLALSEKKYKLPIFHGLRICVTNLDTVTRSEIEHLVNRHGGTYTGDLTKENTHLIAGSASGKKWEAVVAWQCDICIVGVEWLSESIKRGAGLDEKYFRLDLAPSLRGQSAWFPPRPLLRADEDGDLEPLLEKRKATGGQLRQRKRLLKKMSSTTGDGLWTEILVDIPPKEPNIRLGENTDSRNQLMLDLPTANLPDLDDVTSNLAPTNMLPDELTSGIFQSCTFYIAGFARREDQIIRNTVHSNGGTVIEQEVDGSMFITPQNGTVPTQQAQSILVTEYWLERCLTSHSLVDPTKHFTSIPFCAQLPIPRMKEISICISGYSGIDVVHIEKLCKMIGAVYCDTLTRDRSILLASSRECRKYRAAKEKGTRVVKVEWLWECIRRSKMIGISEFAIDGIEGSACRIDGQLIRKQRLSQVLAGKRLCISATSTGEQNRLESMAITMGAVILPSTSDTSLTHIVGTIAPSDSGRLRTKGMVSLVSSDWLEDSHAAVTIQPETDYPIKSKTNDENVPPEIQQQGETLSHSKLASEMNEIRKRLNTTAPIRRTSRKILGRVTSITSASGETDSVMINTDLGERTGVQDVNQGSQVVYSDPEAAEQRRRLLAKLDRQEADGTDRDDDLGLVERGDAVKNTMRAVGLGESNSRSLRNSSRRT